MLSVILTKDVDNLGRAGEIVKVKPGYGRNFLLPRGLALVATRGNVAQLEHHRREIEREQAKIRAEYEKLAKKLEGTSVSIARKAAAENKLFGSVTSKDIAEALEAQNIEIDRRVIQLPDQGSRTDRGHGALLGGRSGSAEGDRGRDQEVGR